MLILSWIILIIILFIIFWKTAIENIWNWVKNICIQENIPYTKKYKISEEDLNKIITSNCDVNKIIWSTIIKVITWFNHKTFIWKNIRDLSYDIYKYWAWLEGVDYNIFIKNFNKDQDKLTNIFWYKSSDNTAKSRMYYPI